MNTEWINLNYTEQIARAIITKLNADYACEYQANLPPGIVSTTMSNLLMCDVDQLQDIAKEFHICTSDILKKIIFETYIAMKHNQN